MTEREVEAARRLWGHLRSWLRDACPLENLRYAETSENEIEVSSPAASRSIRVRFDPNCSSNQLKYELEDGTPREARILVTTEGHADFRKDEVSQNPENFGRKLLRELRETRR